jgi:hypothetical protein
MKVVKEMAYTGLSWYDRGTGTGFVDVSPVLGDILEYDHTFISLVGLGDSVEDPEFFHIEEDLNPQKVTATAALATTVTTLTVTSGHATRAQVGSLLKRNLSGISEVLQVVTVDSATQLTVTRGYGSTTDHGSDISAGDWWIIANPREEGSAVGSSRHRVRSRVTHVTQIFDRYLSISGTQQAARMYAVQDEMAHQIWGRTIELKQEMNRSIINGIYLNSPADDVPTTTRGVIEAVSGGANAVTTTEPLTATVINDLAALTAPYENANPTVLLAGTSLCRTISTFGENQIQIDRDDRQRGQYVTSFISDLGLTLRIVKDVNVPPDVLLILDMDRINWRPYRPLFIKVWEDGSDAVLRRMLGEYATEIRNAGQAHAYHNNLS